jgi:hypothetical protein
MASATACLVSHAAVCMHNLCIVPCCSGRSLHAQPAELHVRACSAGAPWQTTPAWWCRARHAWLRPAQRATACQPTARSLHPSSSSQTGAWTTWQWCVLLAACAVTSLPRPLLPLRCFDSTCTPCHVTAPVRSATMHATTCSLVPQATLVARQQPNVLCVVTHSTFSCGVISAFCCRP